MTNCFLIDTAVLETGIVTTILGFAVVFFILGIIWISLIIFGNLMKESPDKKANTMKMAKPEPVVTDIPKDETPAEEQLMDDKELIAVITATIAAYSGGNTSPDKLVVRSLKRVKSSSWKNRAIYEQQINEL